MKHQFSKFKVKHYVLLICFLCLTAFSHKIIEEIKLAVEPNHSTIQFSIPIANGLTRVTGKFTDFSIDINYIDNDFSKSSIIAKIKATSINTGITDRDNHLKTSDFFDVEKYPEITFVSDSILKQKDHFIAYGKFTMHGVTKLFEFPFKVNGKSGNYTYGISSRLTLKRSDYGVGTEFKHTSIENFLSDDIAIEIDFWTKKRK